MFLYKFYNQWRWPTCIKSVRNWRERFSQENVLGAPITNDKIKHFLKRKYSFSAVVRRTLFAYTRPRAEVPSPLPHKVKKELLSPTYLRVINTLFHIRMSLSRPKTEMPVRKYLITLVNLPDSKDAAEKCIASAKLYGEDHHIDIFPAIDRFTAESFFVEHGLSWISRGKKERREAAMGCFASHFSLWLRCIELGTPIIIMEHDTIFVSKTPTLRFKHIAILSYSTLWRSMTTKYRIRNNTENYYPFSYLQGAGAYAITPKGAQLLVEDARCGLTFGLDNFIRRDIVDIVSYNPRPYHQINYFSSIQTDTNDKYESASTIWDKYQPAEEHPIIR